MKHNNKNRFVVLLLAGLVLTACGGGGGGGSGVDESGNSPSTRSTLDAPLPAAATTTLAPAAIPDTQAVPAVRPAAPETSLSPTTTVPSINLAAPVTPIAPVIPVPSVAPLAPVPPLTPVAPIPPVAPLPPFVPVLPVLPVAPVAPVAPVVPVVPVVPVTPVTPFPPATPVPPSTPVVFGTARVTVALEPMGGNCPDPVGGLKISAFVDSNNNGLPDAAEIVSTQFACYRPPGAAGTASTTGLSTLVSLTNDPAPCSCATGLRKFAVGLDANSNGLLDAAESNPPTSICSTTGIETSISIVDEPRGSFCANAGKQVTTASGGNTTVSYLCYPAPGLALTWKRITTATAQLTANLGHIISRPVAGTVTLALPTGPAIKSGDAIVARGESANLWRITQAAGQTIGTRKLGGTEPGLDSTWVENAEPIHNWWFVASSARGVKLAAVANNALVATGAPNIGYIYTSADAGLTWLERQDVGSRSWASIASSADGTKLAAVAVNSIIWTSADSGATWQAQNDSGSRFWVSITMSADGSRMAAVALESGYGIGDGRIYTWQQTAGNAFGAGPWTARAVAREWRSIASSADGSKLVAAVYTNPPDAQPPIYLSTDYGATWTPSPQWPPSQPAILSFYRVASSAGGTRLVAAERFGKIYTSSDSGLTWVVRAPAGGFNSIASSSDGNTLVAVQPDGKIFISTDAGATWAQREQVRFWRGVAVSADGNQIVAAVNNGRIYRSISNRTTAGTAGSIVGGQTNDVQLRYLGDGLFDATGATGPAFVVN